MFDQTQNVPPIEGAVTVECKNITNYKNFTCGDLKTLLVVIELRVTGLKKTRLSTSWTYLGEWWKKGGVI